MGHDDGKPQLVFLYGPPAVGKLTVANELAARSGFRVLHNHVTIDAVAEILPFGTEQFWEAVGTLRRELVRAAARAGIDLVYTFVFAPGDEPHVDEIVGAYEERGGRVTFVRLVAPTAELERRVLESSRRAHGKITDVETLRGLFGRHDVLAAIPGRDSVVVDVGALSAAQAAERISAHLDAS